MLMAECNQLGLPERVRKNTNTPSYWDSVYSAEIKSNFIRPDEGRWNSILGQIKHTDVILDFGCGWGEWISWMAKKRPFCKFIGIDYSKVAIEKAKEIMPNFTWYVGSTMAPHKEEFDIISIQHTLEHIDDKDEIIGQAHNALKVGGTLIIVLPLYDDWQEHPEIWRIEDIRTLIKKKLEGRFNCLVIYRPKTVWATKDHKSEEAIIFAKKLAVKK